MKYSKNILLIGIFSTIFSGAFAQESIKPRPIKAIPAPTRVTPYQRPTPAVKPNVHGAYPKMHAGKPWDGREPGTYSLRFKVRTLTPPNVRSGPTTLFRGDTVYLADNHIGSKYLRDTAIIDKNGLANFTGNQKLQRGMYLFVLPHKRDYFEFIVDDDQDFEIAFDTSWEERDYYKTMTATGSEQNAAYIKYQNGKVGLLNSLYQLDQRMEIDTLPEQQAKLEIEKDKLLMAKNQYDSMYIVQYPDHLLSRFLLSMISVYVPTEYPTLPNGTKDSAFPFNYFKTHYWDNVDLGEDGLVRMPVNVIKQKLDFYFDKIIPPDADSCIQEAERLLYASRNTIEMEKYLIWYLTNRYESSNIMGMDRAFIHMALTTYGQGRAWWTDSATIANMCKSAYERWPTTIGQTAPPITLKTIKGDWYNTQETKAPWTVMIFWDPTCGHCKEVMPKLAKIYEKNKSRGWKVIGLASGDKKKEWEEYYNSHPETQQFIHLIRGEVLTDKDKQNLLTYYVKASPTIYLLDENNVIQANRIDIEKLEEFIDHLEKEKYPHLAAQSKAAQAPTKTSAPSPKKDTVKKDSSTKDKTNKAKK